jgi:hypothetical protein
MWNRSRLDGGEEMRPRGLRVRLGAAAGLSAAVLLPAAALAATPANDNFAAAQAISGASAATMGTTVEATLEAGEPPHYTSGNGSVWYSWTAPVNSNVRLDTCASSGPTKIQLYRGSSLDSLEEVQPSNSLDCEGVNAADVQRFHVTAGVTYRISVIEYAGDASFTLALSAPPAPANDDFADAQTIGSLPANIAATTTDATVEPGEEGYRESSNDGQSVWYRWTAPASIKVWIDNCGEYGTKMRLYTGATLDSLAPVDEEVAATPEAQYGAGCSTLYNPPGEIFGGVMALKASAGTTYYIQMLHDDPNYDTAFHLGLRDARFDGSISQTSSRKSIRKGRTVTYSVTVQNLGALAMSPEIDLVTSKPHKLARPVVGSRYVSLKPSQGTCKRVKFFAVHPGAVCDPGLIAPGRTVTITAQIRPSGSLSHWVGIDYLHGGEGNNNDDNPRNDPFAAVTTTVTGGHKHRHRHRHHR